MTDHDAKYTIGDKSYIADFKLTPEVWSKWDHIKFKLTGRVPHHIYVQRMTEMAQRGTYLRAIEKRGRVE